MNTFLFLDVIITVLNALFAYLASNTMKQRERLYKDDPANDTLSTRRQYFSVASYLSFMLAPVLAQIGREFGGSIGLSPEFAFSNGLLLVLGNAAIIIWMLLRTNTHSTASARTVRKGGSQSQLPLSNFFSILGTIYGGKREFLSSTALVGAFSHNASCVTLNA